MSDHQVNIFAVFKANSAPFVGALGKISQSLAPVALKLSSISRQADRLGAIGTRLGDNLGKIGISLSLIGGFAANAFLNGIKASRAYANVVADLSDRLGVSVTFLQQWHRIARLNASSAEDVNGALSRLAKQYGALKAGTGSLYAGLAKISPEFLKQIRNAKGVEDAFTLLLKAIRKVEDPAKKAYLAELAFGEAGRSLIASASLSDEKLAELTSTAERGGMIMDETTVKAAQALGDAMTDLREHLRGVYNQMAAKLIPVLTPILNGFTKWIENNRELIATKIDAFVGQLSRLLEKINWTALLNGMAAAITLALKFTDILAGMDKNLLLLIIGIGSGLLGNIAALFFAFGKLLFILLPLGKVWSSLPYLMGAVVTGCSLLKGVLLKLGTVMLTTPFGWVVLALLGLAKVFSILWNKCEGFRNFWKDLWRSITGEAETGVGRILKFLCRLNPIVAAMDGVKDLWNAGKAVFSSPPKVEDAASSRQSVSSMPSLSDVSLSPSLKADMSPWSSLQNMPSLSLPASQPTRSEVTVKFMGLPKNAVVEQKTSGDAVDLGVEYGYSMADV